MVDDCLENLKTDEKERETHETFKIIFESGHLLFLNQS